MKQVLIVEGVLETRHWLAAVMRFAYPNAKILTATSVHTALGELNGEIELALIDLVLPDGSGLDVLRKLRTISPAAIKVVTTVTGDDASILASLSAGADGYLFKEVEDAVLIRQLAQLSKGLPTISPSVARRIIEHFRLTGSAASLEEQLIQIETDVLLLIAKGRCNAEVASTLDISESEAAGYIKMVYRKLDTCSRA
jgi:DNA-binding NarL/FixJ family response regulator